ncbi:MAG: hypothetical protein NTX25_07950 [Proteobacteria bacterium]|nr:hypothetical protein [Pseudomonadota bacterium]
MKITYIVLSLFLSSFFVLGCGKEARFAQYERKLSLCDPQDNPGPCPVNLRDDAIPSREIKIGDEGAGIRVDRPNEDKINQSCRDVKLSLLEKYIDPKASYKGLYKGEFVSGMTYYVLSEGSECTRREITRTCSKHLKFSRVVCSFQIKKSSSLN